MMKTALVLFILFSLSFGAAASDDLADRLLRLPAATRETPQRPVKLASEPAALTGDEPLSILGTIRTTSPQQIAPAVRDRVLARLNADPTILFEAYELLPDTTDAAAAAAVAFAAVSRSGVEDDRLGSVREWIRRRGNFERPQLIAAAAAAQDKEGWIEGEEDLRALARLDPAAAAPILARLATVPAPRVSTLAHVLIYEQAEGAGAAGNAERVILQSIAEDRNAPAQARTLAIEALLASDWKDRDQWYLKLFGDASLLGPTDGDFLLMPLSSPVEKDPDHWIPVLARLTTSADLDVRSNAANILGEFQLERARADALEPLLPWLKDPEWAADVSMARLRLVQSLPRAGLSSAVPALQWMCEHETDETIRAYAAMSLVELSAPDAMKFVRMALTGAEAFAVGEVSQAIVGSGALSENEIADAVIAFAELVSTEEGALAFNQRLFSSGGEQEPLSLDVILGYRLAADLPDGEIVAEKLLGRIQQGGDAGAVLQRVVSQMNVASVQKFLVAQLGRGVVDPVAARSLLLKGAGISPSAAEESRKLSGGDGVEAGIAAVMSRDESAIGRIMKGDSLGGRKGVLAASRITRGSLNVEDVVTAARQSQLEPAAAAYLEAVNSVPARAALSKLHRGERRIWGERPGEDPGHVTFTFFDEWEETLRNRLNEGGAERIDALAVASYWGGNREIVALEFKGEAVLAVIRRDDGFEKRPLTPERARTIRQALVEIDAASLAPLANEGAHDGAQFEFVTLTRDGGYRVFMNNPSADADGAYSRLISTLQSVAEE